ncbi:MAG TPA: GntR family transcriptional regulator [Trueperaceae bacterium]|nr:GntR family transcriptional regulator [Trueperaceae bacterium]
MFDGRDPIYRQIADQIRQDVVEGNLMEEEQVMSTTQYATTFRINPATAAKAFGELIDEGVLYQKRGLGTFVKLGARERLLGLRRQRYFSDVLQPALDEATRIGIPLEAIAAHLTSAASAHSEEKS